MSWRVQPVRAAAFQAVFVFAQPGEGSARKRVILTTGGQTVASIAADGPDRVALTMTVDGASVPAQRPRR